MPRKDRLARLNETEKKKTAVENRTITSMFSSQNQRQEIFSSYAETKKYIVLHVRKKESFI